MTLEIIRIPVLSDNYVWLVHEPVSGETMAVDPAIAEPVLEEAKARGWTITQIWNTHWHPDHTGGNAAIKDATGCTITGPAAEAERIPTLDRMVAEGDTVMLGAAEARVIDVPAHTAGHIAFHFADDQAAFVGDTLFAMGCGRLFEGTAEQMWKSLATIKALPKYTKIYFTHEYTKANLEFAKSVDSKSDWDKIESQLKTPSTPSTLEYELKHNVFLRASNAEEFKQLRIRKDHFRV